MLARMLLASADTSTLDAPSGGCAGSMPPPLALLMGCGRILVGKARAAAASREFAEVPYTQPQDEGFFHVQGESGEGFFQSPTPSHTPTPSLVS